MSRAILITNRKCRTSGVHAGTVCVDGLVIGRAMRTSRVAAGTRGQRRTFYTALVGVDREGRGHSLGTRWVTRRQAVAVIKDFHAQHPDAAAWARDMPPWQPQDWRAAREGDIAADLRIRTRRHFATLMGDAVRAWKLNRRDLFPFNVYPQSAGMSSSQIADTAA